MYVDSYDNLMQMAQLAKAVERGAMWLDDHYADWYTRIDLASLNIASGSSCICGQLFADRVLRSANPELFQALSVRDALTDEDLISDGYSWFLRHHPEESAEELGFNFGPVEVDEYEAWSSSMQFDYLGNCWKVAIEVRQNDVIDNEGRYSLARY